MNEFKEFYTDLLATSGYRPSFIQNKIAEHCGVSIHTVRNWISTGKVSKPALILLRSFEVN